MKTKEHQARDETFGEGNMNDPQTRRVTSGLPDNEAPTLLQPVNSDRFGERRVGDERAWRKCEVEPAAHRSAPRLAEVIACGSERGATLVTSAASLLNLFARIRVTTRQANPGALHQYLRAQIIGFENHTRAIGIPGETRLAARFLLCTALDEAVLNTPWGCESAWGKYSLLSLFHKQTSGGELCFEILGRAMRTPHANIELLELFYRCLSLGFEGCYRVSPAGCYALETLRKRLFRLLQQHRETPARFEFFLRDEAIAATPNRFPIGSAKLTAIVCAVLLALGYSIFSMWTNALSEPLLTQIASLETATGLPPSAHRMNPPPN